MTSVDVKIRELKTNLKDINIKAIKKNKLKPIKLESTYGKNSTEEYNYYLKLIKKIKKEIELAERLEQILIIEEKNKQIVCIYVTLNFDNLDIGIPIKINLISGNNSSVVMDCTYYDKISKAILYINNFTSSIPNQGYGSILLNNLDKITYKINNNLYRHGYSEIESIEGKLIANKHIISEEKLIELYKRYEFNICKNNYIARKIKERKLAKA